MIDLQTILNIEVFFLGFFIVLVMDKIGREDKT